MHNYIYIFRKIEVLDVKVKAIFNRAIAIANAGERKQAWKSLFKDNTATLESVQDFLIKMDIKALMNILEIGYKKSNPALIFLNFKQK